MYHNQLTASCKPMFLSHIQFSSFIPLSMRNMQCFFLFWKNKNICIFFPIYLDSTFPLHGFRCVGFMMAKMVLRELMDPSILMKLKSFLTMVCINQPLKNISFGKVIVFINWYFMSSLSCIFKILEIWIQENNPSCFCEFLLPTIYKKFPSGSIGVQEYIHLNTL